jgi:hypothetical protein
LALSVLPLRPSKTLAAAAKFKRRSEIVSREIFAVEGKGLKVHNLFDE